MERSDFCGSAPSRRMVVAMLGIGIVSVIAGRSEGAAPTFTTLTNFGNGSSGGGPVGLAIDASGNLYGAAYSGGINNNGTVFKIATGTHALSTVVAFNGPNGEFPNGVMLDALGNLFGTTAKGGASYAGHGSGYGSVFEVAAGTGVVNTVVSFDMSSNGSSPNSGLVEDTYGNLYGTTTTGGGYTSSGPSYGTVFKIAAGTHTLTNLVKFDMVTNGAVPSSGLTVDTAGNLYGETCLANGAYTDGTVFKVAAGTNSFTTVATFPGSLGDYPYGGVTVDSHGNLFGVAYASGSGDYGTIFEIAAGTNIITTVAAFNRANGNAPNGPLLIDACGDIFGTTRSGGTSNYGTAFEVVAGTNTVTTLINFNGTYGYTPSGALVADAAGNLYGTTTTGGYGSVFELSNSGFVVVPEPAAMSLLALGALGLIRRRRWA